MGIIGLGAILLGRPRVADVEAQIRRRRGEFLQPRLERVLGAISETCEQVNRPAVSSVDEGRRHAQHRRHADPAADKHHGQLVAGVEKERSLRRFDRENRTNLDVAVEVMAAAFMLVGQRMRGRRRPLDGHAVVVVARAIGKGVATDQRPHPVGRR
jgi:hypothetical protein